MKHYSIILLVVSLACMTLMSCKQSEPLDKEYVLLWEDNFNDKEIDTSSWDIQIGDGSEYGLWRWGNEEDQYYRKQNISLRNGNLLIKAVKEDYAGYDYTSARIRTLNKIDIKYGKVEASIRMSDVAGLWHAFWMLPSNAKEPWPISGEIDIMEYVGREPNTILNTLHLANASGNHVIIGEAFEVENIFSEFHQYAVEWDENKITWYIDSLETFKVARSDDRVTGQWPFDAEFHLLLNTAVGGNLGGDIDSSKLVKPKYMEVDYVRVYERKAK